MEEKNIFNCLDRLLNSCGDARDLFYKTFLVPFAQFLKPSDGLQSV